MEKRENVYRGVGGIVCRPPVQSVPYGSILTCMSCGTPLELEWNGLEDPGDYVVIGDCGHTHGLSKRPDGTYAFARVL